MDRLHCKFCSWSTVKNYQTKDGKFRGVDYAQARLREHVMMAHYKDWERLQSQLDEHFPKEKTCYDDQQPNT